MGDLIQPPGPESGHGPTASRARAPGRQPRRRWRGRPSGQTCGGGACHAWCRVTGVSVLQSTSPAHPAWDSAPSPGRMQPMARVRATRLLRTARTSGGTWRVPVGPGEGDRHVTRRVRMARRRRICTRLQMQMPHRCRGTATPALLGVQACRRAACTPRTRDARLVGAVRVTRGARLVGAVRGTRDARLVGAVRGTRGARLVGTVRVTRDARLVGAVRAEDAACMRLPMIQW